MTQWLRLNGDLVENWAFGIVAFAAVTIFLGAMAVLGLTWMRVHLREVRRSIQREDAEDLRQRMDDAERLLR